MRALKKNESEHNGQIHTEVEWPMYRKLNDLNMYKFLSPTCFVNVVHHEKHGTMMIGFCDKMDSMAFAGFLTNSIEITRNQFMDFYKLAEQKIKDNAYENH